MVKYPEIEVQLTGQDGNAFMILALVTKALKRAGVSAEECEAFYAEATGGDYDNLLRTAMSWVSVE